MSLPSVFLGWGIPMSAGCKQFYSPACEEFDPTTDTPWHPIPGAPTPSGDVEGKCSGDFLSGQIVDHVVIPARWVL